MRFLLRLLYAVWGCTVWVGVACASEQPLPHVRAHLVAEVTSIAPGDSFDVLLHQEIDPGWHTYWLNPGDSGAEPEIKWEVPEGVNVSAFEWPYPERIPYGPLMNFGYHDQVDLPFTVSVPESYAGSTVTLSGSGRILVCEDICIPEKVSLSLSVPVGKTERDDAVADQLEAARGLIPAPIDVQSQYSVNGEVISLSIGLPGTSSHRVTRVDYFPYQKDVIDNPASQDFQFNENGLTLRLTAGYEFVAESADLSGILVVSESSGESEVVSSFEFRTSSRGGTAVTDEMSLLAAMMFAFLGGLILNLMPCVFPVLSIKIFSLVDAVHEAGSSIKLHGVVYAGGVIVSFVAIALLLIGLRLGGEAIGWGFQLQSPLVVGLLAYLFLLIGLNLLGVFEVGMSVMSLAGSSATSGYGGSFATGVLATIVAAPCTAPFMGAAVGFALTQSVILAVVVFASLGAGMAAPYVLLCYSPGLLARLPAPGRWMLILKQVMAFPMFASAVWLLWVLGIQTSATGMMQVLSGGLLLGFAVWMLGQARAGSRGAMMINVISAGLVLAAVYLVVIQKTVTRVEASPVVAGEALTYSNEALESALLEGPVLVNFTAAWCITCKVNELNALDKSAVKTAFAEMGLTYLKGDWTNEDPKITAALQSYGRSGVPLYLLYKKGSNRARILPQLLTEGIVLDALEELSSESDH